MTLSRSPSPHPGGGWSSPGLIPASGTTSPGSLSPGGISWAAAKSKSEEVRGYPSFSTRNSGFFSRQRHKISTWFPSFRRVSSHDYIDKDDYGRNWKRASGGCGLLGALRIPVRRGRFRLLLALMLVWVGCLFFWTSIVQTYRRSPIGGGSKFVIILGSNVEGGRYSHEWRESWEKGDVIREAMRKYPDAEWFWWLDLNTWVMEYDISLQQHLFNDLKSHVYRDITAYNPLNITHPLPEFWLDELGRSLEGDGQADSLNMLLTQDCAGFNLGSFFLRRSLWTDRLLDIWWDPVMYEQMHMEWEHKEQDALEYIYQSQPWVRSGVGFLPKRSINAFPPGACGDGENPVIHYQQNAHDLVVNMAGCIFGRDCWSEIYYYRELSNWLGRSGWEQFRDGLTDLYDRMTGKDKDD
ncbi:hypothetical protein PDIDSM_47 [Penicillium digitatum]|nr:hypothetical protein PDIDSM_47 [Penicillium digitatum]